MWSLDERRLVTMVRDAHNGSVGGMEFIQSQPLMATSSVDNSIKVIFTFNANSPAYWFKTYYNNIGEVSEKTLLIYS